MPEQTTLAHEETLRFNHEITSGAEHIAYDFSHGIFTFAQPGTYVVNITLFLSSIVEQSQTQLQLLVDGNIAASHDIIVSQNGIIPVFFSNILTITEANTALCIKNIGADAMLSELPENTANISIWGIIAQT